MEGLGAGLLVSFVALLITALGMKRKSDDAYLANLIARMDLLEESAERKDKEIARLLADNEAKDFREQQLNRQIARLWRELDGLRGVNGK